MSQAKGITFYGSVASVGQHLAWLSAQKVSFELGSLDVIGASEPWTPC